jgi:hypothetical protein
MLPHGAFLSYSPSFTPAASANKFAFWASFFTASARACWRRGSGSAMVKVMRKEAWLLVWPNFRITLFKKSLSKGNSTFNLWEAL